MSLRQLVHATFMLLYIFERIPPLPGPLAQFRQLMEGRSMQMNERQIVVGIAAAPAAVSSRTKKEKKRLLTIITRIKMHRFLAGSNFVSDGKILPLFFIIQENIQFH